MYQQVITNILQSKNVNKSQLLAITPLLHLIKDMWCVSQKVTHDTESLR